MKIAISGWYGARNLGDEAILTAMLESISSKIPDAVFHVFSKDSKHTSRLHSVESSSSRLLSVRKTLKAIKGSDAFILGGGGFLHKYSFSAFWMSRPTVAHMMKKPVTFYSLGLDKTVLQSRMARWLIGRTANRASLITVRDTTSRDVLVNMGVKKQVHVTMDPVLGMKPFSEERTNEILRGENLDSPFALVSPGLPGFSLQKIDSGRYIAALAGLLDHVTENLGLPVVLVPFKFPEDLDFCHLLKKASTHDDKVRVLEKEYAPKEVLGVFSKSQFAVCARYHANIFAIISGVPCVSIMYMPEKHEPLLRRAGIERFGLPVQDVSSSSLIEKVTHLIQSGKEIRSILSSNRVSLEDAAKLNVDLFQKTLEGQ